MKSDYVALIKNLLPPGPAWPRDDSSSAYANVIDEIAGLCADIDTQALLLADESDVFTCAQSFADWETDWGLPDECVLAYADVAQTMAQRRAMLILKASLAGGQNAAWYERLAKQLGRSATVEELRDGDPKNDFIWRLNVRDPGTSEDEGRLNQMGYVEESVDDGLLSECLANPDNCVVLDAGLVAETSSAQYDQATVQMSAKDPLASFGDVLLECVIRRYRPAHTTVLFSYI